MDVLVGNNKGVRALDLASSSMFDGSSLMSASKIQAIKDILVDNNDKKVNKKEDVDPEVIRESLIVKQNEGLISDRYKFEEMDNEKLIRVNNALERNARIMAKVHTYKMILSVLWAVIDYGMSQVMPNMAMSYLDMQLKFIDQYKKILYTYAEKKVEEEDAAKEEHKEEDPLSRIIHSSIKMVILVAAINMFASKVGPAGANFIKPIANKVSKWLVTSDEDGLMESNADLEGSVDLITETLSMLPQSNKDNTKTEVQAVEVESNPTEGFSPPY